MDLYLIKQKSKFILFRQMGNSLGCIKNLWSRKYEQDNEQDSRVKKQPPPDSNEVLKTNHPSNDRQRQAGNFLKENIQKPPVEPQPLKEQTQMVSKQIEIQMPSVEQETDGLQETTVTIDNLDIFIQKTMKMSDSQKAIERWGQTINFIVQSNTKKSFEMVQKLAYSEANLGILYSSMNHPQSEVHYERALEFYRDYESTYFEEIISILNNWAFAHQSHRKYGQAIQKYKEILRIQDKYFSIDDQRRLLALNNLGCSYYEQGQAQNGRKIFNDLQRALHQRPVNAEISELIKRNSSYYEKEVK